MSGELIVKNNDSKKNLLAFLITAVVVLAVMLPMARMLLTRAQTGMMTQIAIAILVPVLIVVLRPQMEKLLSGGKQPTETLPWSIRGGTLTLGEKEIPLKTIKMVYCWQKGSAWTINIETTGKNQLLRSVDGPDEEESVQRLYELVDALGYRSQWKEV